jgi:ACS family glucarate transporter-like MFS transporter
MRFRVLAFIGSLSILTYLDRVCISRVGSDIQRDLGFNDLEMGFVFGAFVAGYGICEVPGGWMGDRWGPRRVLTRIVLWWSLFTGLTGAVGWLSGARDYVVSLIFWEIPLLLFLLVAVRFLFGCGEAGAYPNLALVIRSWFPFRERGLAQGMIWMCARLGGALAPVVIGQLTFFIGWKWAFAVLAVLGLVWAWCFYMWFRDRPSEVPGCDEAEPLPVPTTHHAADTSLTLRRMLKSGSLWALCASSLFVNLGWWFFPTWQPRYLKDVYGLDPSESEILQGLPFLCGALGALSGGHVSDRLIRATGSRRWGRSLVGLAGFGGAGLLLFVVPFARETWLAVTLLCLVFLINDLAVPVLWVASADVGGRAAGTITGVMNMAGSLGAFLSPVITGAILGDPDSQLSLMDRWPGIFALYASAGFTAGLAWLFVDASREISARPVC